jgi:hypothetical protein
MNYYQDISKEEELARFKEAAISVTREVTASKESALEFLISVGFLPPDYKLPKSAIAKKIPKPRASGPKAAKVANSKAEKSKTTGSKATQPKRAKSRATK